MASFLFSWWIKLSVSSNRLNLFQDWLASLKASTLTGNMDWCENKIQFSSVAQSCLTLCDPMNLSTPGLAVLESTHTHVHWVSDAIQPSHLLSPPSPPALNLSQQQGLSKWVSSSHQVAKILEFQLQHQSFQWTPRAVLLQNELVGSPCSPRDSQESSPTPQFKSINSWCSAFFIVQPSHPNMTTGKTIALTRRTFVDKVMRSRLVIQYC